MKLFVVVLMLIASGIAVRGDAAVVDPEGDTSLGIDIERLGVVNERTQSIWLKLRSEGSRRNLNDSAWLNSELRRTVWELNELREDLCRERFMVEKSCGPPYVPKWVYESLKDEPSANALRARQEDLADHVMPLWDAACKRLEKLISNEDWMPYCSIE
jgi:hypothetical protein